MFLRPRAPRSARVLAVALAAVLVAGVVGLSGAPGAVAAGPDGSSGSSAGPSNRPVTPVLSARRLPGVLAASQADARLQAVLAAIVASSTPTTCVSVRVGDRVVDRVNGDQPMMPASTEKLLTATAVLDHLGADKKLATSAVTVAANHNGVIEGDLYVVGGGDPLLTTNGYTSTFEETDQKHNDYAKLADAIKAAGVTQIDGNVLGDDSRFDTQRYLPSWPGRYLRSGEIGPLGALMVNDGFTGLSLTPEVPTKDRQPGEPAVLAAETLISLLKARGVAVTGGPSQAKAPDGATTVASLDSLPIADTVGEMLRRSDNTTAEVLVKDLAVDAGQPGTTADGARVVHDTLGQLGLPVQGSVTVDGSGLDLGNRVTCDLLTAALAHQGPSSTLAASLPVAGKTGTLRKRLRGTAADGNVRAKTGTLNEVAALAGFARTADGEDLTFAVIVNGVLPTAVAVTDQVAVALAEYGKGVSIDALGPRPAGS
ncbi:MAG TPA: D-alanyl-D-alanine carboxypeptidase/D-alanyl-D-alanine-endopeptidase [Acidimicrobiales bacterium]